MKADIRVERTEVAIKKTFKEMICEMPAEKITVKELSERAMIHRKTFYLHYASIELLYEEMLKEALEEYYKDIDQLPLDMPMKEINQVYWKFAASQDTFIERMICAPSYRIYCNKLFSNALEHNRKRHNPYSFLSKEEQNIVNCFLGNSTNDMYRQWVADGKKISIERMTDLCEVILCEGINGLLKEKK